MKASLAQVALESLLLKIEASHPEAIRRTQDSGMFATAMSTLDPAKDELLEQLKRAIRDLLVIKGRLPYLLAISNELVRMNGDDGIPIRNYAVYRMSHDSYDMLVIDLASLREGLTEHQGLFNRLCEAKGRFKTFTASDCDPGSPIYVGQMKTSPDGREAFDAKIRKRMAGAWNKSMAWLFPNGVPVMDADIKALIRRFLKETKPTDLDRNRVRAHRYENDQRDASALRQSLHQISEQVAVFEKYLNQLFLVLTPGGQHDMRAIRVSGDPRSTANDLADIMVWGSISQAARKYGAVPAGANGRSESYFSCRNRFLYANNRE